MSTRKKVATSLEKSNTWSEFQQTVEMSTDYAASGGRNVASTDGYEATGIESKAPMLLNANNIHALRVKVSRWKWRRLRGAQPLYQVACIMLLVLSLDLLRMRTMHIQVLHTVIGRKEGRMK